MNTDPLETKHHRLHLSEAGLTLYNTDRFEDEDDTPTEDDMLHLSPSEVLWIVRYTKEHQQQLTLIQDQLDVQCEKVSQEVLAAFPEALEKYYSPGHLKNGNFSQNFDHTLAHTLTYILANNPESHAAKWFYTPDHGPALTARRVQFWRYFNEKHRDQLKEIYKPKEDAE
ncbi:MAG TPA: hypothetical protein VHL10_05260 [Nitrososphaera sp.]|jgi:DNA-binding GntR family transcriptional regulator|nr:hypothetical protein [Nitrososphaera sp.]